MIRVLLTVEKTRIHPTWGERLSNDRIFDMMFIVIKELSLKISFLRKCSC